MLRRIGVFVAFALMACGHPPLDQGGAIRCGTESDGGVCPPEFECRWDHCCPVSSNTRTCPAPGIMFVRDPSGHAYAPIGGTCPAGYEVRFDRYCCPTDSGAECPTRVIGAQCENDMQCDAPPGLMSLCLTNQVVGLGERFPHGYCTAPCNPMTSGTCGDGAYCSQIFGETTGICTRTCQLPRAAFAGPCEGSADSQICILANDVNDPNLGICVPDCGQPENAGQCVAPFECAEPSPGFRYCLKPCSSPADCSMGATCHMDVHYCLP